MFSQNPYIDIKTGFPLDPILKDENGQYLFPNTPCGFSPFFIGRGSEIFWGFVETDRVGIIAKHLPAGTQNLIVIKGTERFEIEVSKKFKNESDKSFLAPFLGKNINNDNYQDEFTGSFNNNYQDIITCCINNGYEVYLDSMITTALNETYEEHGADFRGNGRNRKSLINIYEFEPQPIHSKREGAVKQKVFAAQVISPTGIQLKNPFKEKNKTEDKISVNNGLKFYERGIWCTLEEFKNNFTSEKLKPIPIELSDAQKLIIEKEFIAWESRIKLMEKIELSIVKSLNNNGIKINSTVKPVESEPFLKFNLVKVGFKHYNAQSFKNDISVPPSQNLNTLYNEKLTLSNINYKNELNSNVEFEQIKAEKENEQRKEKANKKQQLLLSANELIKKLIGNDFKLEEGSVYFRLEFNSKQEFESLQKYEKTLISAGISVKLSRFLGGESILYITDRQEALVVKLYTHFSQPLSHIFNDTELKKIKTEIENTRRREETEKNEQILLNKANELITNLIENKCELETAILHNFTLKFDSKQEFAALQKFATVLTSAGLIVKLENERKHDLDFLSHPGRLHVENKLEIIVKKISVYFSQKQNLQFKN